MSGADLYHYVRGYSAAVENLSDLLGLDLDSMVEDRVNGTSDAGADRERLASARCGGSLPLRGVPPASHLAGSTTDASGAEAGGVGSGSRTRWHVDQVDPFCIREAGSEAPARITGYFMRQDDAARAVDAVNNGLAQVDLDELVRLGKSSILRKLGRYLAEAVPSKPEASYLAHRWADEVDRGEK